MKKRMNLIDLKDKNVIELEEQKRFPTIGLNCNLVYKDDEIRIYRTETLLYDKNNNPFNGFNSYEIFKRIFVKHKIIKIENNKIINNIIENTYKEKYPCSEDFGYSAWSCSSEGSVRKILKNKFSKSDEEINSILSNLNFK